MDSLIFSYNISINNCTCMAIAGKSIIICNNLCAINVIL